VAATLGSESDERVLQNGIVGIDDMEAMVLEKVIDRPKLSMSRRQYINRKILFIHKALNLVMIS
jgi:hypothetical protein